MAAQIWIVADANSPSGFSLMIGNPRVGGSQRQISEADVANMRAVLCGGELMTTADALTALDDRQLQDERVLCERVYTSNPTSLVWAERLTAVRVEIHNRARDEVRAKRY